MSLPYERGSLLPDTAADMAKLRAAWRIVERRHGDGTLVQLHAGSSARSTSAAPTRRRSTTTSRRRSSATG